MRKHDDPGRNTSKLTHVMHVTHDLGVGGLPRVVTTLAKTIDRNRFDVSVLCLNDTGPLADELTEAGVPVHLIGEGNGLSRYLAFKEVATVLRREDVDVLHTHNTQPFIDGGIGGILAGLDTHIHTDHARDFPDKLRYMAAEWLLSHVTYRVVGVSEDTSRKLARYEKISEERIETIPNGIEDLQFREPIDRDAKRQELDVHPDVPVIGVGVRFTEQKGLSHLIEALPRVRNQLPDVVVLMAGYGPLEDDLRGQARKLGVADAVRFLGKRLDMPDLMRVFDVYALPSIWEGLPLVVLEAMAAGCPVVASRVGGVPTAVEHRENGLLVEPRRPDKLAAALVSILRDDERRRAMGRAGRRRYEESFSAEAMTREYEALYRRHA